MLFRLSRRQAGLAAGALTAGLLFGCGGGGTDSTASATTSEAVALTETATDFTVIARGAQGERAWSTMHFGFTAEVTAGTHAGSRISGLLLLRGETDETSGATDVEGRLFVGTLPFDANGAAHGQPVRLLTSQFRTQAEALRAALRAQVQKLRDQLEADLAAAVDDAARLAAKQKFSTAFQALMAKFQQDMMALVSGLRDALTALGLDPSRHLPGGRDGSWRGLGRGGFEVAGTITADGKITGTLALGDDQVIQVSGQKQADGSFKGSFAGPASDDTGNWTATSIAKAMPMPEPVPMPTPPASAAGM